MLGQHVFLKWFCKTVSVKVYWSSVACRIQTFEVGLNFQHHDAFLDMVLKEIKLSRIMGPFVRNL